MRKAIYFSERLDKDLISYMNIHNFNEDFSQCIKQLMRSYINRPVNPIPSQYRSSSHEPIKEPIKLTKKVNEEQLNDLLDRL